jgi:hypothetical protein
LPTQRTGTRLDTTVDMGTTVGLDIKADMGITVERDITVEADIRAKRIMLELDITAGEGTEYAGMGAGIIEWRPGAGVTDFWPVWDGTVDSDIAGITAALGLTGEGHNRFRPGARFWAGELGAA